MKRRPSAPATVLLPEAIGPTMTTSSGTIAAGCPRSPPQSVAPHRRRGGGVVRRRRDGVAALDVTRRPGGACDRGLDCGAVDGLVREQVVDQPIERCTTVAEERGRG